MHISRRARSRMSHLCVCVCAKDLDTGEKSRVAQLQEDQKEDFQRNDKNKMWFRTMWDSVRMRLDTFSMHFVNLTRPGKSEQSEKRSSFHRETWSARLDV